MFTVKSSIRSLPFYSENVRTRYTQQYATLLKKGSRFSRPPDVTKLPLLPARESVVSDIPAGDGKNQ
jgi:hypothetical protein